MNQMNDTIFHWYICSYNFRQYNTCWMLWISNNRIRFHICWNLKWIPKQKLNFEFLHSYFKWFIDCFWDLLTFQMFAFALCKECNGNFDIIFEGKCFEWLFDWCRWSEDNTIRNDMSIDNLFIDKFRSWMWLQFGKNKMRNEKKNQIFFFFIS